MQSTNNSNDNNNNRINNSNIILEFARECFFQNCIDAVYWSQNYQNFKVLS